MGTSKRNNMLRVTFFVFCNILGGLSSNNPPLSFPYNILLIPEGCSSSRGAQLEWNVNFDAEIVNFRLNIPLTHVKELNDRGEWIAFGLSPDGTLTNAGFVVFWYHHEKLKRTEAYTDKIGTLQEDGGKSSYVLLGWRTRKMEGGKNYFRLEVDFQRKFDTCDPRDYRIEIVYAKKENLHFYGQSFNVHVHHLPPTFLEGKEFLFYEKDICSQTDYLVIYAIDIQGGTVGLIYVRGNHSSISSGRIDPHQAEIAIQRVQLLKSKRLSPSLPTDVKITDITMHFTKVPNQVTTYWCKVQRFPNIEELHHIIQYEPVVTPGNEQLVHHMEVFHCILPEGNEFPDYNGQCEDELQPPELDSCRRVIGAWAMGASSFSYPQEAGVPMGGIGESPYVMLQVHYNNPTDIQGVLDSSGIRFYYTTSLRPFNAGILEVGATYSPNLSVPPTSKGFYLTGHCVPDCTNQGLPSDGIRVFASQLHTHLSGTAVWTKHIRNGVEIKELNRDNHYSSMFQEIRLLQQDIVVLPGDALVTTCRYDTSSRPNVTLGGFGIQDEMCVNYLHYYPSSGLEVCKSTVSSNALEAFFKFVGNGKADPACGNDLPSPSAVAKRFLHVNWTSSVKLLWQYVIDQAPIDVECLQFSGQSFHGKWKDRLPPIIKFPLPRKRRQCSKRVINPNWSPQ